MPGLEPERWHAGISINQGKTWASRTADGLMIPDVNRWQFYLMADGITVMFNGLR